MFYYTKIWIGFLIFPLNFWTIDVNFKCINTLNNSAYAYLHGLIVHEIIQVNSNVVEAFLGRIHDPKGYYGIDPELKIFNDPAFRIILVSKTKGIQLLQHELGQKRASILRSICHEKMRSILQKNEGREVELEREGFVASFVSVTQAVKCAVSVQQKLHVVGELMTLK